MEPIRVLLVDDHPIVREGVRVLLSRAEEMVVVAEAETGEQAVARVLAMQPEVVVMDIMMPGMNGIEATRRICRERPHIRVLCLSMNAERQYVVEVLRAGACGYLLKDCAGEELVQAIRSVVGREAVYLCPSITADLLKDYLPRLPHQASAEADLLAPREREVLAMIAAGSNTKEIAFAFGVSSKTVETQRQQVMKKLQLHTVAELTKYAIRTGITTL